MTKRIFQLRWVQWDGRIGGGGIRAGVDILCVGGPRSIGFYYMFFSPFGLFGVSVEDEGPKTQGLKQYSK